MKARAPISVIWACVLGVATWAISPSFVAADSAAVDSERPPGEGDEPRRRREEPDEPDTAAAPRAPRSPAHIIGFVGAGSTVRLVNNLDFGQTRFAPSFVELSGAYVFAGRHIWRHGAGLSVSANITGDGYADSSLGVDPFHQFTFTPHYVAYFRLNSDFLITAHAGLNLVIGQPSFAMGGEVGASFAYFFRAGVGVFARGTANVWAGEQKTYHPAISLQGGLTIDYEVLP